MIPTTRAGIFWAYFPFFSTADTIALQEKLREVECNGPLFTSEIFFNCFNNSLLLKRN
jgi:hypothetical protein